MRWRRSPRRREALPPLDRLDPDELEVIELDDSPRSSERPRGSPPIHEASYGDRRDPASLAGVWEALGRG